MNTYYPVPLHMHSVWERNASMEGHFYNAQKLGIRHMYLTDHDVRMGRRANHIDSFDFTKGQLRIEEPSPDPRRPRWHGFIVREEDAGTSATVENGSLCLQAESASPDWSTVRVTFDTSQKRHEWALLGEVLLALSMKISPTNADIRILIDVELSQRPPAFLHGHILYVFGNCDGLASSYATVIPMQDKEGFASYAFPLLRDAAPVGGGDNVLRTVSFSVSVRNGKAATLFVNHLAFRYGLSYEAGRQAQQQLANTLGKKYGVTPFVTSEITAAGPHKICFSTKVPIIDYAARDYKVTDEEAMEHVRAYGGIYARNHPFESVKDAYAAAGSPEEKAVLLDGVIEKITEKRAWHAAMLEVGFPEGREGISLADHLRLWDALSAAGVFITGYGDSDNHTNDTAWFDGNNFVAYIGADAPDEEGFLHAMRAGNLYTGDPVYLQKIGVSFGGSDGRPMGQVYTAPTRAVLSLTNLPDDCRIVWTANGQTVQEEVCRKAYNASIPLPEDKPVNFVRVALYKADRCILLTNPIYYVRDNRIKQTIPAERSVSYV
ncbi:MAG: hypothetical protein E7408_06930 [Ruminococcaceae bacterium]|nr:hypothetical protein [Oscillospiraceae bacterium]